MNCTLAGICILGFGIVSLAMPQWNIGDTEDSIGVMMSGVGIFTVGLLIGIIPIIRASKDNHKGVVKDMIIASIGSTWAVFITFMPFVQEYSQKKYQQYLEEEKQSENIRLAEQERIDNSFIVNKDTGERYSLNSDGTMFKDSDGDWVNANEAIRTGNYKRIN